MSKKDEMRFKTANINIAVIADIQSRGKLYRLNTKVRTVIEINIIGILPDETAISYRSFYSQ